MWLTVVLLKGNYDCDNFKLSKYENCKCGFIMLTKRLVD